MARGQARIPRFRMLRRLCASRPIRSSAAHPVRRDAHGCNTRVRRAGSCPPRCAPPARLTGRMTATGLLLADRYRMRERIGAGGMATVWRAHDVRLGRDVAVKILRPQFAEDEDFV